MCRVDVTSVILESKEAEAGRKLIHNLPLAFPLADQWHWLALPCPRSYLVSVELTWVVFALLWSIDIL